MTAKLSLLFSLLLMFFGVSQALACDISSATNYRIYKAARGEEASTMDSVSALLASKESYRCVGKSGNRIKVEHGTDFKQVSWVPTRAFTEIERSTNWASNPRPRVQGDALSFGPPTCECKGGCKYTNSPYSSFGTRPKRIAGGRSSLHHKGTDVDAQTGTPIAAVEKGTVIFAGVVGGYGKKVEIRHTGRNGRVVTSTYSHLNTIKVKKGQSVSKGQLVGTMGATGRVTGSHLHFELHDNTVPASPQFGQAVDPTKLISFSEANLNQSCAALSSPTQESKEKERTSPHPSDH